MKKLTLYIILLFFFLMSFKTKHNHSENFQIQSDEMFFSINDNENVIIKDYTLYTKNGRFNIDDKATNINEYTFDLIYKNKIIGRYSVDDSMPFCELYTSNKKLKKEIGIYGLISLKKINDKKLSFEANNAIKKYTKDFIKSPENLNNKGYFLYKLKFYDASLLYFNKTIQLFPYRTVAYLNIADNYWELKDKANAIDNYKKYIQLMNDQKKDLKKIPKYVFERIK
jgi:tetratricopeptide (TPR) repeat protein